MSGYLTSPGAQTQAHYSGPKDVVHLNYADQFDQVSLAQMNQEAANYQKVKPKQVHAGYDDIKIRR
jgi:hypothetical protein